MHSSGESWITHLEVVAHRSLCSTLGTTPRVPEARLLSLRGLVPLEPPELEPVLQLGDGLGRHNRRTRLTPHVRPQSFAAAYRNGDTVSVVRHTSAGKPAELLGDQIGTSFGQGNLLTRTLRSGPSRRRLPDLLHKGVGLLALAAPDVTCTNCRRSAAALRQTGSHSLTPSPPAR